MSATISLNVRISVTEEKLRVAMKMIGNKHKANKVALAPGISTKAAYHMMQRINDFSQNDINSLNTMKIYGPKVTQVITNDWVY